MNLKRAAEILETVLLTDVVPLIEGPTGIGKSEVFQQVADKLGMTLIDIRLGEAGESCDIFGLPTVIATENGERRTIWSRSSWWPKAEDVSKPHLILWDEVNRASDKDTMQTIFKVLLKRQFHDTTLPIGWKQAAAINPDSDEYYVQAMDSALQARFIKFKITCDSKVWLDWAYANGVNRNVIDFISTDTSFLHNEKGKNNPRSWTMLGKILDKLEETNRLDMLFEVAEGLLDAATAATFNRFVEGNLAKPVKAADLLSSFAKVKPQLARYVKENKIDVIYATNTELEHYDAEALISGLKNLIDYILFLPPEVGYKLIRGLMENKEKYSVLFRKLTDDARIMKLVASVDYTE